MNKLKHHIFLLCCLLALSLTACHSWRPWGVMNSTDMEDVLYDIHLTEGMISAVYPNMRREDQRASYDAVFEKHHVTREKFEKSLEWYSSHPDLFTQIYDSLDVRFGQLVKDVKSYKYHDEMSHMLALDTLAKVNIYGFPIHQKFLGTPKADEVSFDVNQQILLAPGDKYVWRFYYKSVASDTVHFDTLPNTNFRLNVYYANGTCDSAVKKVYAKGCYRKLTVTVQCPDTLQPVRIQGSFFDGTDQIQMLRLDSATLMRYYNGRLHPLPEESYEILDSIAVAAHRKMSVSATRGNNPLMMGLDSRQLNVKTGGARKDVRLPKTGGVRQPDTPTKRTEQD